MCPAVLQPLLAPAGPCTASSRCLLAPPAGQGGFPLLSLPSPRDKSFLEISLLLFNSNSQLIFSCLGC